MTPFTTLYRRWHALTREADRLDHQADQLNATVDAPYPLLMLPDYAGGGAVSTVREIKNDTRLTPEDRAELCALMEDLLARRIAAEEATGVSALCDRAAELWSEANEIAKRLMVMPARTLEELHARSVVSLHYEDCWTITSDPKDALFAIRRDLGEMIRERRQVAAVLGFADGGQEVERLLEMERRHFALDQEYEALGEDAPNEVWQPAYQKVLDLETAIAEAPISTFAGALVKLRLALGPVGTGSGENPNSAMDSAAETLEAVAMKLGYRPPWTRLSRPPAAHDIMPAEGALS